ncbi:CYTH domain-containing protein [Carnobacterium sp. ISL-102]|uniref:CYTH domain-containing protein n=1 Tax=Carnobacterium sp. ISL-102 TaxID=2819142 RepID=UPI0020362507|nr:CYTH domain-containing protein [Carnobacterium sp. ISL-102]
MVTKRYEKKIEQGLIVIDESSYSSKTDYELEFEINSREVGEVYFDHLLQLYSIKKRSTKNKIKRMMESS